MPSFSSLGLAPRSVRARPEVGYGEEVGSGSESGREEAGREWTISPFLEIDLSLTYLDIVSALVLDAGDSFHHVAHLDSPRRSFKTRSLVQARDLFEGSFLERANSSLWIGPKDGGGR